MIYLKKPIIFNAKFEIASCFIEFDNTFLMLFRSKNESLPNTWGLPAGKIENNEEILNAIMRELKEETGIISKPNQINYWGKLFVKYPNYDCVFHMSNFKIFKVPNIILDTKEHSDFCWVTPNQALKLHLIPDMDSCIKVFYKL